MLFTAGSLEPFRLRANIFICLIALIISSTSWAGKTDNRGDVNLNGIPFEQADIDIFAEYFVAGLAVFTIDLEAQVAATDVNYDGIALSVADLVYMIRVGRGEISPDHMPTDTITGIIAFGQMNSSAVVGTSFSEYLASLTFNFSAINIVSCEANLLPDAEGTNLEYDFYGSGLDITVTSTQDASIRSGLSQILNIDYDGDSLSLNTVLATGYLGEPIELNIYDSLILGDVNLNQIDFDIADVVLFSNYHIYGESVFQFNTPLQTLSADVNNDGVPLTIEDFEYMMDVITGEIEPGSPVGPEFAGEIISEISTGGKSGGMILISSGFEQPVGALTLGYYAPNISTYGIILLEDAAGMDLGYDLVNDTLKIMLYTFLYNEAFVPAEMSELMEITYEGDEPTLIFAEAAGDGAEHVNLVSGSCPDKLGDANGQPGLNLLDVTYIISYLYLDGPPPVPTSVRSADADCNCSVSILDITKLISFLYKNGDAPCSCSNWMYNCSGL